MTIFAQMGKTLGLVCNADEGFTLILVGILQGDTLISLIVTSTGKPAHCNSINQIVASILF